MVLTDKEVSELKSKNKKYRVSCGSSLFIEVYPEGGKYFCWCYRFQPGRKGQQRLYQIGPYSSKKAWSWNLKQAKEEKARLDVLRRQAEDPRELKCHQKAIKANRLLQKIES